MLIWLSTIAALAGFCGLFGFIYYLLRDAQRDTGTPRGMDSQEPGGLYTDFVGDRHFGQHP